MKKYLFAMLSGICLTASAIESSVQGDVVQIKDKGAAVSVKNGVVTGVSGADFRGVVNIPAGLGVLRSVDLLRGGHIPWGEPALEQCLPGNFSYINYFRPVKSSKLQVTKEKDSVTLKWVGLSNGKEFLKDAEFSMNFSFLADGTVKVIASGRCAKGGVFAAVVPFGMMKSRNIVTPTLGGMKYFTGKPAILTFGNPPYLEAPFACVEFGNGKTFGLWLEDPTFRPAFFSIARHPEGFAPAVEVNTLMPFEDKTEVKAPAVYFKVFNGDWKAAATPFRRYYQRTFSKELAVRDSVAWTDKITVSSGVEMRIPAEEELQKYTKLYGKDKVLMMTWNARSDAWDVNLPNWQPRAGYVEGVARAQKNHIRTMAYVNICCANYYSDAWKANNMDKVFLTRKNSMYQYKNSENNTRAKALNIGNNDYGAAPDLMQHVTPGHCLYGDLLSHLWREFHVKLMIDWYKATKTDANYEDTAGTTGDHGNGVVRGLSAGQGDAEQMRMLLKAQPHVPNAGEFAPAAVAFGILWPLNYPTVYGNHQFRVSRLHRQVPLSNYLYGYRQWLTDNRGYSDFLKYLQSAVGDSVGGFGFISSSFILNNTIEEIEKSKTYDGFIHRRAKLYSDKNLKDHFPQGDYPVNVSAMFKGDDGIYSLFDDGNLQEMRSPAGKAIYGRVDGVNRAKTLLAPANWPFHDGKTLSGLNKNEFYALFADHDKTDFYADSLPENVYLESYFSTPDAVYMKLNSASVKNVEFLLKSRSKFEYCSVNGKAWTPGTVIKGELPMVVIGFKKSTSNGFAVPRLMTGQMCGKAVEYTALPVEKVKSREMKALSGGDVTLAIPVKITGENMVFEAIVRDWSDIFMHPHDGVVLRLNVNGKILKEIDSTGGVEPKWIGDREARKLMFDHRPRKWSIPLGKMFKKGEYVLVNIESFSRSNFRGDKVLVTYEIKERN